LCFARVEEWDPSLAPHAELLRSIDPAAAVGVARVDGIWVACAPGDASAESVMTAGQTREECLAQCLADALAVRTGGSSERRFQAWLPDLHEFDDSRPMVGAEPLTETSLSALLIPEASIAVSLGLVDITPVDLRGAGLHVWKAICLTRPR
jgi:hypothetical protein